MKYHCENSSSLDEHHSHFILVDDGSEGKFGKEIELRAKLEKHIGELLLYVTFNSGKDCTAVSHK